MAIATDAKLLAATVEEHPPTKGFALADRPVTIRFVVPARPACSSETTSRKYTMLIDAFPWRRESVSVPAFPELRFDSSLVIRCDPGAAAFAANIAGTVSVEPATESAGAYAVVLRTTVDRLPAVEFRWVALASDGARYTRAPGAGQYARWALRERRVK